MIETPQGKEGKPRAFESVEKLQNVSGLEIVSQAMYEAMESMRGNLLDFLGKCGLKLDAFKLDSKKLQAEFDRLLSDIQDGGIREVIRRAVNIRTAGIGINIGLLASCGTSTRDQLESDLAELGLHGSPVSDASNTPTYGIDKLYADQNILDHGIDVTGGVITEMLVAGLIISICNFIIAEGHKEGWAGDEFLLSMLASAPTYLYFRAGLDLNGWVSTGAALAASLIVTKIRDRFRNRRI